MADNYTILDSADATKTFDAADIGAGVLRPRHALPDGADVTKGALADAPASSTVAEDTTARTGISLWKGIKNILILLNAKFVAGTVIGNVAIDQTTPGTTNKVVASVASGGIASGAIASGAVASGAIASGAIASGALAAGSVSAGAVVSGAILSGALATGAIVDLPAKGQAAMAASVPVTMASDQTAFPVKGSDFSVSVDLTVDAGAYSIGDALGAMMNFADVASANGKRIIINTIVLAPNDAMPAIPFNMWILNADLATPIAKNAAWNYVAADNSKILTVVPITAADYIPSQGAWNVATCRGVGAEMATAAADRDLYVYLVCTATTAPVATSIHVTIAGECRD